MSAGAPFMVRITGKRWQGCGELQGRQGIRVLGGRGRQEEYWVNVLQWNLVTGGVSGQIWTGEDMN